MLASGPLDLCPALACSSHHRKWDLLVALPSGRSPGQAPVSSLLQEVSSRRNASSPKYSDAQDLYIVLGSPEPISEKRLWGRVGNQPLSRLWLKLVQINKKQLLIHKVLPELRKCYFIPKPRSLWSYWLNSKWGKCSFSRSLMPATRTQAETGLACRQSQVQMSLIVSAPGDQTVERWGRFHKELYRGWADV